MRAELANYHRFAQVPSRSRRSTRRSARPGPRIRRRRRPGRDRGRKGSTRDRGGGRRRGRAAGRGRGRLAGPLGCGPGRGRAGDPHRDVRLGASLLGQLLATDTGHRGPRIDCGPASREPSLATTTRTSTPRRACRGARAPTPLRLVRARGRPARRRAGVADASLSPGLRKITARAAATAPFAQAADLLADLAGIPVEPLKRIESIREADGGAAAARLTTESAAIAHRRAGVRQICR